MSRLPDLVRDSQLDVELRDGCTVRVCLSTALLLANAQSRRRRSGSKRGRLEAVGLGACGWKPAPAEYRRVQYERAGGDCEVLASQGMAPSSCAVLTYTDTDDVMAVCAVFRPIFRLVRKPRKFVHHNGVLRVWRLARLPILRAPVAGNTSTRDYIPDA